MKFLFYLGHPAHYHNFSVVSNLLKERGHEIIFVARKKDVLFDLLEGNTNKIYYIEYEKKPGKTGLISFILKREWDMFKIVKRESPDLLIGTDITITHIGKLFKIPSIVVNEDDADVVPMFANLGMKYATFNLAPESCNVGPYSKNTIRYKGFQELSYLHPNHFNPDASKVETLLKSGAPYFIIRLAELTAHHDKGKKGITKEVGKTLIDLLKKKGKVFITSERELEPEFEEYRISIHPKEMHHAMYFAEMYIGDSQTMAAEAAILGTPSIRFNDFVGEIGYLEDLEHNYGLTYGIRTNETEKLFQKVSELLDKKDIKKEWRDRKNRMLEETDNVAELWIDLFENKAKRS
jgi:predicted glycosyltransferase